MEIQTLKLPRILPSSNSTISSDRPVTVKLGRKISLDKNIFYFLFLFFSLFKFKFSIRYKCI